MVYAIGITYYNDAQDEYRVLRGYEEGNCIACEDAPVFTSFEEAQEELTRLLSADPAGRVDPASPFEARG